MLDIHEIKKGLISKTFIQEVHYFEHLSSTNDYARELEGKDNILIVTDNQTKGRGRFDRVWESEPYKNLSFSILKKINIDSIRPHNVNFFFCYYLLDAISQFLMYWNCIDSDNELEIKWPNDLLYGSKKFSGLLIESNLNRHEFVVGIGINVNQVDFNKEYTRSTTSLKAICGEYINLNALLVFIIRHFSKNIGMLINAEHKKVFELWKDRTKMIGKSINFKNSDEKEHSAQVIDINEDGSIKLSIHGKFHEFYSGEIKNLTN